VIEVGLADEEQLDVLDLEAERANRLLDLRRRLRERAVEQDVPRRRRDQIDAEIVGPDVKIGPTMWTGAVGFFQSDVSKDDGGGAAVCAASVVCRARAKTRTRASRIMVLAFYPPDVSEG
jgi:hypothetical protein